MREIPFQFNQSQIEKRPYFETLQDKTICETPVFVNPFSTNVPFMDKPGIGKMLEKRLWKTDILNEDTGRSIDLHLHLKCHSSTGAFQAFCQ